MGIPLVKGRDFGRHDTAVAPRVAIVNQAFARQYFPDGAPRPPDPGALDRSTTGRDHRCRREHPSQRADVGGGADRLSAAPAVPGLHHQPRRANDRRSCRAVGGHSGGDSGCRPKPGYRRRKDDGTVCERPAGEATSLRGHGGDIRCARCDCWRGSAFTACWPTLPASACTSLASGWRSAPGAAKSFGTSLLRAPS